MNRNKQSILARQDLFLTTILTIIIDEYGQEALDWDIETIKMELEQDAKIQLSNEIVSKIGCMLSLLKTDIFYKSLPDFINICNIISNDLDNLNFWKPADAYSITAAIAEIRLMNPPDEPIDKLLDPEITTYIELMLRDEGIVTPPQSLNFVNPDNLAINDLGTIQDDPVLFAAGYQQAQSSSEDLQTFENNLMKAMLSELSQLQLEHGDVSVIFKKE